MSYFSTPPLAIVDLPAQPDHFGPRRIRQPWAIVLHSTVGTDSRAWLTSTSQPPVSVHRLIDRAGTIYKLVGDDWIAWHAGSIACGPYGPSSPAGTGNDTLGIELENASGAPGVASEFYPDLQIQACAAQIVEWWGVFGFLPLLGHGQADARKHDPIAFPWPRLHAAITGRLRAVL